MAVTLTATARLNTGPFIAGLGKISSAVGGLGAQQSAVAAQDLSDNAKRIRAHSDAGKAIVAETNSVAKASKTMAAEQARATRTGHAMAQGLSSQRYLFHDLGRQMTMYSLGLAAPFAATVAVAGQWENAFSAVERTADPAFSKSTAKVNELRDSLVDMVQAMPISFSEVTEIATLANQMGIASSQVADFTRSTAMFAATSGVSVDQAATAFGRLTSIMGDNAIPFNEMADSILKVGVNSVATEGEIINVTTQISSIAAQAGFSTQEMIGLSGALASVRVPPELSRGLVTRVFGTIDKAVAGGGASLDRLARLSGRTSEQFKSDWQNGGGGKAFTDFLGGLKTAGASARNEIEALGITSVRDVPVLLRLANAADSDGKVGGLLEQTMKDAQNAAGETQRQYSIMADTVWSKMKVLGNNVLAMFDEIGSSNLGGFGDVIDNVANGIRRFTDSLDEPMKILGGWEMPWTNAEALGGIANLSLMAAGLTGLGAIGLKVGAGVVGMKQMAAVLSGGKIVENLTGMQRAGVGAAAGVAEIATAGLTTRPILASLRSGVASAATSWSNLGLRAGNVGLQFAELGKNVTKNPILSVTDKVPAATGILGNFVRFGLHPATIAIGAATAAAVVMSNQYFDTGTEIKTFSEQLASVDSTNIEKVGKVVSGLEVGGAATFWDAIGNRPWDFDKIFQAPKTIKPFQDGLADASKSLEVMAGLRDKAGDWIGSDILFDKSVNSVGLGAAKEGIEGLGQSMQMLVDSGNKGSAIGLIENIASSGKGLKEAMNVSPEIKGIVSSMFASADIEMTDAALDKLAKGTIPELTAAYTGLSSAATLDIFEGDVEAAGKFEETVDKAAAAFISFGDAMSSATTTDENGGFLAFDLGGFSAGLAESIVIQDGWKNDMVTIAGEASTGVVEALANLGPAAQPQIAAIAAALSSEDPAMRQAGLDLVAQMEAGVEAGMTGFGGTLGQVMADKSWLRSALGDSDFADYISANLTAGDLSSLRVAGANASQEIIQGVAEGLANGNLSIDQAIMALEQGVTIPVEAETEPARAKLAAVEAEINRTGTKPVTLNTGPALGPLTTLDSLIKKQDTKPVDADTSNATAKIYALNGIVTSSVHNHTINTREVKTYETHGTPFKTAADSGAALNPYQANGSVLSFFANGGMSQGGENHTAQFAPAGSWRVFGEAETEGEAYIPLARRKRTRSLAILDQVASRFGMSLTGAQDTARFADGGQYASQQYSRATRYTPSGGGMSGLTAGDKQFLAHVLRTVQVTAEGQAITGLTNNINSTNTRFGR